MFIKPTKKASGSVFDIHPDAGEILLYTANEDVPCPWDANVIIEGDTVLIFGGLLPGGSSMASCRCGCPIADFSKYYKLEVPDDNEELLNALEAAGWERA